ncbi:MAG: hypothetical protein K6U14_03665 [Firmicutes bacterium]|nr:hypothetical protein [Alicyclobacillaceae bacterium]MCL6496718.1 hypothetical protein [Bacillota bacterium]
MNAIVWGASAAVVAIVAGMATWPVRVSLELGVDGVEGTLGLRLEWPPGLYSRRWQWQWPTRGPATSPQRRRHPRATPSWGRPIAALWRIGQWEHLRVRGRLGLGDAAATAWVLGVGWASVAAAVGAMSPGRRPEVAWELVPQWGAVGWHGQVEIGVRFSGWATARAWGVVLWWLAGTAWQGHRSPATRP